VSVIKSTNSGWLVITLLAALIWGVWAVISKLATQYADVYSTQLYFSFGLLPLLIFAVSKARRQQAPAKYQGWVWGFITGILGGVGNITFYAAFANGGLASIVTPAAALAPALTLILALVFLSERLSLRQWLGFACSLISLYLFSV
jgi:bacterial/archaeal transporter family protein